MYVNVQFVLTFNLGMEMYVNVQFVLTFKFI